MGSFVEGTAKMESLADLKGVLKETLEARGSLGQIKARIRAEIFAALDDEGVPKPKLSNENLIINELIREYLEYNGYRHTQSVFLAESGQPAEPPFHRQFVAKELRVEEDPRYSHVPLLYGIVSSLQQARVEAAPLAQEDEQYDRKPGQQGETSPSLPSNKSTKDRNDGLRASQPSPVFIQK
ncbi:hypothetical protein Poli38472_006331 [Pythium oligandrum]|uniref:Centrosomal protein 20 n=1 Tax=Pythium oligandrum TaxID=41045 RepID=A0A8K1C4K0_PYTOL|nr:hypothetical protein Poli38472_006331 [Pythium oligandrum]|eukprot:TMW56321.1 hypothetical protein Poli38472_006331 [Pythium oligandrum]